MMLRWQWVSMISNGLSILADLLVRCSVAYVSYQLRQIFPSHHQAWVWNGYPIERRPIHRYSPVPRK